MHKSIYRKLEYRLAFLYTLILAATIIVCKFQISSAFPGFGFSNYSSIARTTEAIGLCFLLALFLPKSRTIPSSYFIHLHFVFPIIGMLAIYSTGSASKLFMYMSLAGFITVIMVSKLEFKTTNLTYVKPDKILVILLTTTSIYIVTIIAVTGFSYFNLNVYDVYAYRRDAANSLPGGFGYITPMIASVVTPLSVVLAYFLKKRKHLIVAIILSILCFAFTAHKSPLVNPFIVLGLVYFVRSNYSLKYIAMFVFLLVAISSIWFLANPYNMLTDLFVRRILLVPAQLNFVYQDFFFSIDKIHWANSSISFGLVGNKFDISMARVVGEYVSGSSNMSANTGWIGSGYMHAGYIGVALYSVLVGFILSFVNSLKDRWPCSFLVGAYFIPLNNIFTASDIPTAFLTHGLLLLMLLTFVTRLKVLPDSEAYRSPNVKMRRKRT